MDSKTTIGRHLRKLREQKGLTQEQVATKANISYQFVSGLENGRENVSIDTLEAIGRALGSSLHGVFAGAFADSSASIAPTVSRSHFRQGVPLPPGLTVAHLEAATNATQSIIGRINGNLVASGAKPLKEYIQGNNFSGLVSNVLCDALSDHSPYKHNSHQAYPDLINMDAKEGGKPAGLEVKSTIQIGKGGESHNGHSGWHLIACFQIEAATGNIRFVHLMSAVLNGHSQTDPDWKYVGSKVNADTGSRRTETYNTSSVGTTKLRDGSVFLDPTVIDFRRWKQTRKGAMPVFSIFHR